MQETSGSYFSKKTLETRLSVEIEMLFVRSFGWIDERISFVVWSFSSTKGVKYDFVILPERFFFGFN